MRNICIFSVSFFLFTLVSFGQSADTILVSQFPEMENDENEMHSNFSPQHLKPHWKLMMGSNFTFSPGFGNATGFFVAPMLNVPLNSRLSLQGGIIASNTYLNYMRLDDGPGSFKSYNDLSIFGSASYLLSENLVVYGTGTKRLTELPHAPYPFMPSSANSFTIGTNWRLGKNISIGASFTTTDRYLPFNNLSPFSPFGPRSLFP